MSPSIRDGECLIVAPVDPVRVGVGDVILCQMRRGPIAHRVCAIESKAGAPHFTLYGDASLQSDRPVAAHQLRGQVVSVERDGKPTSLRIVGGALGRGAFMMALRLRRAIRVARAQLSGSLIPAPTLR